MNPSNSLVRLLPLSVLTLGLGTGCSVVRENVISSVNTGFGVHVTQNPQTQVPEIKVGYLRSQFYSIPTAKTVGRIHNNNGKRVTKTDTGTEITETGIQSIDPSNTPELVSGIRAGANAKSGIVGMDISENFAVGKVAVNSKAAIAMYISQATNAGSASAAAASVASDDVQTVMEAVNKPDKEGQSRFDELVKKELKSPKPKKNDGNDYASTAEYAEAAAGKIRPGGTAAEIRLLGGANLRRLNEELQKVVAN